MELTVRKGGEGRKGIGTFRFGARSKTPGRLKLALIVSIGVTVQIGKAAERRAAAEGFDSHCAGSREDIPPIRINHIRG